MSNSSVIIARTPSMLRDCRLRLSDTDRSTLREAGLFRHRIGEYRARGAT